MKSKSILIFFLITMAGMILFALMFPAALMEVLNRRDIYGHLLFIHILSASLFFANAVVGILWETRSLASGSSDTVLYTYRTVTWLDARFSSPLIIISTAAGIMLSISKGSIWDVGWLSLGFLLFLFSGLIWVIGDIPTQYRVKRMMGDREGFSEELPPELLRLLKLRLLISLAGVIPLLVVFALMIYKPSITPVSQWF